MSIGHMSHVVCDDCGNPGPLADDAKEARSEARAYGFVRLHNQDLCRGCFREARGFSRSFDPDERQPDSKEEK